MNNTNNTNKLYYQDSYDKNKFIDATKDIIYAKGGDGTLLKAINKFKSLNKPFFGISGGTKNFLMNKDNIIKVNAKWKKFNLIKIQVEYKKHYTPDSNDFFDGNDDFSSDWVIEEYQAFNDIFISEENGWIDFNCKDKDYILGDFKGSGLIISTPQGSTGINKNNNGVILPLSSNDWSITGDKTNRKINYILNQEKIIIDLKSRRKINIFIDGYNKKIKDIRKVIVEKGDEVTVIFNNYREFKRKRVL